jgi:hypothetical protein
VLVLTNAPRQRKNVAAIVKGAEARGFHLVASDVVADARGADPSIVMVRRLVSVFTGAPGLLPRCKCKCK